jgi:hypothetical protein
MKILRIGGSVCWWLPLLGEVGWGPFMNIPDIQNGLKKLGFQSPWIKK